MKTFIFKVENTTKNPSIYGGRRQKATIYQVKKNNIIYIGQTEWHTASYRGSESEVNQFLINNKYIPKSWSKGYSFQEQRKYRGGYFTPYYNINDNYRIKEV